MFLIDQTDKAILMILQRGIPITGRPYQDMAEEIGGITENEVIERIAILKKEQIIRRMSGFFNSRKLGYVSVLCAISVPEDKVEEVAKMVNSYPGVTHNYLRKHRYNMWFTLIAINEAEMQRILDTIEADENVEKVLRLFTNHRFKIDVTFDLGV